ncbi:MAG: DUF1850 domain-containing protein [Desulfovibrio sp.]|nr:DUF1850 domain-containing protein [Desulfovibrio sp.]
MLLPIVLLLLVSLTFPVSLQAEELHLVVQDSQKTVLFQKEMREGQCFGIRFIHSVAKSPVEDWYCVHDGTLFLEKTVYQDFGAGLPHCAEAGQSMRFEKDKILIEGFHRKLPEFTVRVGRIAEHTLLFPKDNGTYDELALKELANPGSPLTFAISR